MTYQSRNILYFLSRFLFWAGLLAICAYVVLSAAFYFIGQEEFYNLQHFILSHQLIFLVPILFAFGWVGTRLFRDTEDESSWRVRSRPTLLKPVLVLLLVGLAAFAAYALVLKRHTNGKAEIAQQKPDDKNETLGEKVVTNNKAPADNDKTPADPQASAYVTKKKVKDTAIIPPAKSQEDKQQVKPKLSKEQAQDVSTELSYKVASKAYFYNSPDENTRRNAFISHWDNSYATLYPKDDKNGFVYIVFTNEKGQTSTGWLRKKDLKPVKEIVYNSIK